MAFLRPRAMDDWDEADTAVKVAPSTWDDDANDVPDVWDVAAAEPKEEVEPPKPEETQKTPKKSNKKAKKTKNSQEILPEEPKSEEETAPRELTEKERQRLAEEAEIDLIADSFGSGVHVAASQQDDFKFGDPQTEKDFVTLASKLSEKIRKFETSPYYSKLFEGIIRQISLEADLDTLKDVSTFLGALIVEKQKLAKGKTKKKAGKTAKLIVERKDDYDYDMGGDEDFDDFI